jgi:cell division protein FtsW (lipid II flippase)
VPAALIIKERDLGTGIVFIGFTFAMLFRAGREWRLLALARPLQD